MWICPLNIGLKGTNLLNSLVLYQNALCNGRSTSHPSADSSLQGEGNGRKSHLACKVYRSNSSHAPAYLSQKLSPVHHIQTFLELSY